MRKRKDKKRLCGEAATELENISRVGGRNWQNKRRERKSKGGRDRNRDPDEGITMKRIQQKKDGRKLRK